jgi:hypothetical protein
VNFLDFLWSLIPKKGTVLNSLHSVIYLLETCLFNLEFAVLLPNFAICVHATGTCVCNTTCSVSVSHTIHRNCESTIVESIAYTRTLFPLHFWSEMTQAYIYISSFTLQADGNIKDMTFLAEYSGDVDYLNNRANDDCDCLMMLLLRANPSQSLVICPDKWGNISCFFSGINNHTP